MEGRITPENITRLEPGQVFIAGTNEGGTHGAGSAKTARQWGLKWGFSNGRCGNVYAIPTKRKDYRHTLPLDRIREYVDEFIEHARSCPEDTFLVTAIGTGYAHIKVSEIAPMFAEAIELENVWLPQCFWDYFISESRPQQPAMF